MVKDVLDSQHGDHGGLQVEKIISTCILWARTQSHGQSNCAGSWEM